MPLETSSHHKGNKELTDFDVTASIEQDVVRLDVSVDNILLMKMV